MKTILIVVLSLALVLAAFMTRPGRRELVLHLLDSNLPKDRAWSASDLAEADAFLRTATFKDRLLWVEVEREGKPVYVGAFAHFFARGEHAERPMPSAAQLAQLLRK